MPSYARLHATVTRVGANRVLEVVNTSDDVTKYITVQLTFEGEDLSELLLDALPLRLPPHTSVQLMFSSAPGPRGRLRGIHGVWHGLARR